MRRLINNRLHTWMLLSLVIITCQAMASESVREPITIELKFADSAFGNERFVLKYWHQLVGVSTSSFVVHDEVVGVRTDAGNFRFRVYPSSDQGYFSLGKEKDGYFEHLLYHYLVESGDSVLVVMNESNAFDEVYIQKQWSTYYDGFRNFKSYRPSFFGNGSAKYQCRYSTDSLSLRLSDGKEDKSRDESLAILAGYADKIAPHTYERLRADIVGKNLLEKYRMFSWDVLSLAKKKNGYATIKQIHEMGFTKNSQDSAWINVAVNSPFYLESMLVGLPYAMITDSMPTPERMLKQIDGGYSGLIKDRLLCLLLLTYRDRFESQATVYRQIQRVVRNEGLQKMLHSYSQKFLQGAPAFPFELEDADGKLIKLADLEGKLLLLDFWFTGCSGCSHFFMETLSTIEEEFRGDNRFEVISISIDQDRKRWLNSVDSKRYTSEEAINVYTNGDGSAHELIKFYNIESYPTIVIIDNKGRLYGIYHQGQVSNATIRAMLDPV
ncbi:TlpA family protein disulfide reductase [Parapedobacter koreensis]|nr:TlpA disulfide reductase family protein [Parapedobacter koreensis]